jgi:hypothetical protein
VPLVLDDAPPLPGEEARYAEVLAVVTAAQKDPALKNAMIDEATKAEKVPANHVEGGTPMIDLARQGWRWMILQGALTLLVGLAVSIWPHSTMLLLLILFAAQVGT